MPFVQRMIPVATEPEKLIDYIAHVENHPAFIPALKSVSNVTGDPKLSGTEWDWAFMMAGITLTGKAHTVEYVEGKRFSYKTEGGIESVFSYSAKEEDGEIRLVIEVDYQIPDTVLGKVANKAAVERLNNKEADSAAENLKLILESQ